MSFSSDVKKELCSVNIAKEEQKRAELAGIIYLNCVMSLSSNGPCLLINTESMDVVKRTISLYKSLYNADAELLLKDAQLKKAATYVIRISGRELVFGVLKDIGLNLIGGISLDKERFADIIFASGCREAFLRGAFLGAGSISDPEKEKHLELVVPRETVAEALYEVVQFMGLNVKKSLRKLSHVIYFKQTQSIIMFLTIIGAHGSVLKLESIQVFKEIKNDLNRKVNLEQANQDRTINSSLEAINNIKKINEKIGLGNLSKSLQAAAVLRLDNPDASLAELAELGGVSKSCINHRLRRLNEIAATIT